MKLFSEIEPYNGDAQALIETKIQWFWWYWLIIVAAIIVLTICSCVISFYCFSIKRKLNRCFENFYMKKKSPIFRLKRSKAKENNIKLNDIVVIKKENEIMNFDIKKEDFFKNKEMKVKKPSNIKGNSTSAESLDSLSYKPFDDDFSTIESHEQQSIYMLTTDAITSKFTKSRQGCFNE